MIIIIHNIKFALYANCIIAIVTFDVDIIEDDYCTLKEALSGITSPTEECTSPFPPFSPPSPSTARDVLIHAFESRTDRDSGGSDESSRRGSDCRSRTLKYENVMFDKPSPSSSSGESGSESRQGLFTENFRLSSVSDGPLNEYEEWKKVRIYSIGIVFRVDFLINKHQVNASDEVIFNTT